MNWKMRLAAACGALFAVVTTGLFVPARVEAAPVPKIPPGMCSVDDWQNPLNWAGCAGKLQGGITQVVTCAQAPTPDDPTSGIAGWVSERTDADLRPGITDRATKYGVAGYGLSTYGQGCPAELNPLRISNGENELASGEFQVAAAVVGGSNNLREHAYRPGGVWGFMDGLVGTVVDKTFRFVFTPFGVVAFVITGLWVIWRQNGGNLSESAKTAWWAFLVAAAMIGLFRYPLWAAHQADTIAASGIEVVHGIGQGPQDAPAGQCVNPDPQACQDHRTTAGRASAVLVDNVLYRNWLRAELGSADSATAKMYGPALYGSQALTWDEAETVQAHPEMRRQLLDAKAAQFNTIAAQIKQDDPLAYEHLQGGHGMDRVWAGLAAVLSAVFVCAFDLIASTVILFGFLLVRLAIMVLPLLATIGIFRPWSGPLRAAVDAVFSAIYNIVLFAALSSLYLLFAALALTSSMPGFLQIFAIAAAGVVCWVLRYPLRRYRDVARLRPTRRSRRATAETPTGRHSAEGVPA